MIHDIEKPVGIIEGAPPEWASDVLALAIRNLNIPYVTLNPGASFRGLHDSLVNYLGNKHPKILLCLHEEHAVAIAHGYAKVAEKPLAAILHSNVGLMHGSMAIFNAFCDRVPVLVLGATGPVDSDKRRPWIDWIHTAQDQAGLIRNFIKWDDQPGSVNAAVESIYRSFKIANTAPKGPVYICFDVSLQEQKLEEEIFLPEPKRFIETGSQAPDRESIIKAVKLLNKSKNLLMLVGRSSKKDKSWFERIDLAERLNASVVTDRKMGSSFPTSHSLHVLPPLHFLSENEIELFRSADVILSLDWIDLAGTLFQVWPDKNVIPKVINISLDVFAHNGWSMDYQGLPPTDINILCEPDNAVPILLNKIDKKNNKSSKIKKTIKTNDSSDFLTLFDLATSLKENIGNELTTFVRLPGGWPNSIFDFNSPLDFLGFDGGGGIGSGPGMSIGSALAIRDLYPERLAISIIGDGDFLMGQNAFWTAAHYKIPLLTIVANNKSYFNDEMHQDRIARQRNRPPKNRWIGQQISDPDISIKDIAISQGLKGIGPIKDKKNLSSAIISGIHYVKRGGSCVVDVNVGPRIPLVAPNDKR